MRIVEINAFDHGSTGNIMLNIAKIARKKGYNAATFSTIPFSVKGIAKKKNIDGHHYFGSYFASFVHYCMAQITDANGFFSVFSTISLISKIKKFSPDVIHLHNLHEYCISLPLLFRYIKKNNIKVVWTFHDCWAFTGHCMHFDFSNCSKWMSGCENCPYGKVMPRSRVSNSKNIWKKKVGLLTGVKDMTIVTPSVWLAGLVGRSFLKDYPIKVINNGIDLSVFKPTESDFRKRHNCENKYILLGVAFGWDERKGLDVFVELSKRLDERFQIVLVGTNEKTDELLPGNIISIHKTQNQKELAEIYSCADLFINPTREDSYPTVNMESLACGVPVLTFETGGSPEILDESCGAVVPKDDINALYDEIIRIYEEKPFSREACLERAKSFDMNVKFEEYIDLFEENKK